MYRRVPLSGIFRDDVTVNLLLAGCCFFFDFRLAFGEVAVTLNEVSF